MRLLVDTQALLWALSEPQRLSKNASDCLVDAENDVFVSAVSAWEVAIKQSIGKLTLPAPANVWLLSEVTKVGFEWISITPDDALRVGALPWHHRDPFDRLLVAQAAAGYTLITADQRLAAYGVPLLSA